MAKNITSRRRRIMLDDDDPKNQTDAPIIIDIIDVKMWARCNKGTRRGEKWANVLKRAQRFETQGVDYEIKYYSSRVRRSEYGDGVVDVVRTKTAA
jgi:hypothetical protein